MGPRHVEGVVVILDVIVIRLRNTQTAGNALLLSVAVTVWLLKKKKA